MNIKRILFDNLERFGPLSDSQKNWLEIRMNVRMVPAKEIILHAGEFQNDFWFNVKGLFKYYYINSAGSEKIKYFCTENRFILSISSFLEKTPSLFFVEALEDSTLISIPAAEVLKELSNNGFWHSVFHAYLVESILEKEKREADFLLKDSETRYREFIHGNPVLAMRLRQYEIAAYLGMDPAHLSRIRTK